MNNTEMNKNLTSTRSSQSRQPDLSLAIPCYNEEDVVRSMAAGLAQAFLEKNVDLELVIVDNGSEDETGKIIDELINEGLPIAKMTVEVNQGYGHGILAGLEVCQGTLVGFMCGDGQVAPEDVVRLYQIAADAKTPKLFKVRRRFRLEGPLRRIVSFTYNLLTTAFFGNLGSMDINANPKILPKKYINSMNLHSKDWFLDPEVMIKAKRLGLDVLEMNIFSQMRPEVRTSNVRPSTCWQFIVNLLKFRFSRQKKTVDAFPIEHLSQKQPTSKMQSVGSPHV